jgi:putative nucleotide binding protein
MPRGRGSQLRPEPLAQVLGIDYFTLLEVVPKEGADLKTGDKIYVGRDDRDKIDHIKRRITYKDLTNNSVSEVESFVKKMVSDNEEKYVKFFNESAPITLRRHQLELLPGLGKKHMLSILQEREKEPFKSFRDIAERVHLMPDPALSITKRILQELEGDEDDRHYLFCRPPAKEREFFRPGGRPDFRNPREEIKSNDTEF